MLPQTQCGQCGFKGCWPYAEAIADGKADIDQCPPGGQAGIEKLAKLLGIAAKPLNLKHGSEKPRQIAFIDENACIGCSKCLPPCPVDAIIGSNKRLHTVITDQCSGCELCLPACPVDCIVMQPTSIDWSQQHSDRARLQHHRKQQRAVRVEQEKQMRLLQQKQQIAALRKNK